MLRASRAGPRSLSSSSATDQEDTALPRSLVVVRGDETLLQKLGDYAISPIGTIWSVSLSRVLRLDGTISFASAEWGTRKKIEARAADPAQGYDGADRHRTR